MFSRSRRSVHAVIVLSVVLGPVPVRAQAAPTVPDIDLEESIVVDRIEEDGSLVRRQRQVATLRTAAGVQRYSQVMVPFFERTQQPTVDVLRVTKPDGSVLDVLPHAPRDVVSVLPAELPILSDLRVLRLAVPSLALGDRVTFESTLTSQPLAGAVWTEFGFLDRSLVTRQSYELDLPAESALLVWVRPGLEVDAAEELQDGRRIRRWSLVRPGEEAPGEAQETTVEPDIEVSSFRTWEELGRWWGELSTIEVSEEVRRRAEELTRGRTDSAGKLRALHGFVAREIRYVALPLGMGRYQPRGTAEVLASGMGDCKDKHRLLASLAAAVGIEVEPFLLSAAGRELLDQVPSMLQFDHVISRARLGADGIWMDATSEMTAAGDLPLQLRGVRGLLLPASGSRAAAFVTTPEDAAVETVTRTETVASLADDGMLRARVRWTFEGDNEALRLAFKYGNEAGKREAVEALSGEWKDSAEIGKFTHGDPEDLGQPFWVEYEVEWKRSTHWVEGWDLWVPVPRIWLAEPSDAEEGAEKVALVSPRRQVRVAKLALPEGVPVTAPVPVAVDRDLGSFRADYRVEATTLVVERELLLKSDEASRAQFAELQALYDLIRDDRNQRFTLAARPGFVAPEDADSLASGCFRELAVDRFAEAEPLCRRAVELDPQHRWAWNNLGRALRGLGRPEEAEAAHRRQLEVNPHDEWSYANLGLIAWDRGDLDAAEKLLRQQIDVTPLKSFGYLKLGRLLAQGNRFEEAELVLGQASKLEPENEEVREELLGVLARSRRYEPLYEMLERNPKPFSKAGSQARAALYLGRDHFENWSAIESWVAASVDQAEAALDRLERPAPDGSSFALAASLGQMWKLRGLQAEREGRLAEARDLLDASASLTLSYDALSHLSDIHRKLGDRDLADLQLAMAAHLESYRLPGEPPSRVLAERFEQLVPTLDRRDLLRTRAEVLVADWHVLHSQVPEAAGEEGDLWLLFDADGKLLSAGSLSGSVDNFLRSLGADPPSQDFPSSNRARIPFGGEVRCSGDGDCRLQLHTPLVASHKSTSKREQRKLSPSADGK